MRALLGRLALGAALALPVFLMHGRAVAEVLIGAIDAAFLARCLLGGGWAWLRLGWVRVAASWWLWLVVCSLPAVSGGGAGPLVQALAVARFLVLVAALQTDVLAPVAARRWLGRVVVASALYIGLSSLLQFATGRNLMGFPRGADGELTGPFEHPRAAAPLSRLMFPAMLPLLARARPLLACAAALAAIGTMVLIGQRMPLLLAFLGFAVCGALLPRLRPALLAGMAAGVLVVAASSVVSPPAFHRLVEKFASQMADFGDSDYGQIAGRALAITAAHPLFGQGFDAYRRVCADPRYFVPVGTRHDGGGAGACNIHPHNHYLEAATEGGLPGLALFCALVATWLAALARGLPARRDPLRVGLFAAALIQEWPLASASGFTAVEIGGVFFLLLGWGLAEADAPENAIGSDRPPGP